MRMPLLALAVFLTAPGVEAVREKRPTPTIDTIRRGLSARAEAYQNASFRVTYQLRKLHRMVQGAPMKSSVEVIDVLMDANNNNKIDMAVKSSDVARLGMDPEKPMRVQATQTQAEFRQLNTATDGKTLLGKIRGPRAVPWSIHPARLLAIGPWSPTGYLVWADPALTKVETIEGHEVVRFVWSMEQDGGIYRSTFWVAPDMGYAVVRSRGEYQPRPNMPWREADVCEREGFTQTGPLWLPTTVRYREYQYSHKIEHHLQLEAVATFENWQVNVPISDKSFYLEFPPQTRVIDDTGGKRAKYIKGQVDDGVVRRQADRAKQIKAGAPAPPAPGLVEKAGATPELPPEGTPVWLWAIVCLVVVGVSAAIARRLWERRRLSSRVA